MSGFGDPRLPGRPPDRLTQPSDAAAFGIATPRTVVTTRPTRHRPGGGACVVKAAGRHRMEPSPGGQRGLFPRPPHPRLGGGTPEPAPVIVRQYLPPGHELRVFVVGDAVLGYRVAKRGPEQVRRVDVDTVLAGQVRAPARYWRLDVVAFDLLVRSGTPVFLEARTNCDWRWFEHRAGDSAVSAAVTSWVTARFEELLEAAARSGAR